MTRDELLRKVEDALIASPGRAVIGADGVAKMPVEAHAAAALDAVLTAIADDLNEQGMKDETIIRDAGIWEDAADRVRSMTGDQK